MRIGEMTPMTVYVYRTIRTYHTARSLRADDAGDAVAVRDCHCTGS